MLLPPVLEPLAAALLYNAPAHGAPPAAGRRSCSRSLYISRMRYVCITRLAVPLWRTCMLSVFRHAAIFKVHPGRHPYRPYWYQVAQGGGTMRHTCVASSTANLPNTCPDNYSEQVNVDRYM